MKHFNTDYSIIIASPPLINLTDFMLSLSGLFHMLVDVLNILKDFHMASKWRRNGDAHSNDSPRAFVDGDGCTAAGIV